jgi:hypothetical protein
MRWVIGILVVVVLVIIGYQYFGERGMEVANQAQEGAQQAGQEAGQAAKQATEEAAEATQGAAKQAEQAAGKAAEQAQKTAEQAASGAQQATEQGAEATQSAAQQAQESAGQAAEQAQETAEQAATGAQQATEQAAQTTQEAAQATGEAAEEVAPAAGPGAVQEQLTEAQVAALTVGDVNVGQQVSDITQKVQASLQGATDAQSAQAAATALKDVNAQLDKLSPTVTQLPDAAKKVLADLLSKRVTELKALAADVTAKEDVGKVVKPALDPVMAKLEGWAKQPA